MARWGRRRISWRMPVRPVKRMRLARPAAARRGQVTPWKLNLRPMLPRRGPRIYSAALDSDSAQPKRRRRRGKRWILLIMAVLLLLFSISSLLVIEKKLQPPLMRIAQLKVKQIMTEAINKAIMEQVASDTKSEDLIDWKTNESGKTTGFMMNYNEHMKITAQTIETVQRTLKETENFREGIPLGQAFGSALLSSFGPRVPIRYEPLGDARVELSTRQKDAGINSMVIEVYLKIRTELSIIIPYDAASQTVEMEIPISYLMVVGDVPTYYYDGKGRAVGDSASSAPALALPPGPAKPGADGALEGAAGE
ncbi:sporulation protein YunB [Paenibacillus herberti]|nr:sporulation protein YunB [Paenibacillus herberti]